MNNQKSSAWCRNGTEKKNEKISQLRHVIVQQTENCTFMIPTTSSTCACVCCRRLFDGRGPWLPPAPAAAASPWPEEERQ